MGKKWVVVVFDTKASNSTLKNIFISGKTSSSKNYNFIVFEACSDSDSFVLLGNIPRTKKDLWFISFRGNKIWCSKQFSVAVAKLLRDRKISFKSRKRTYLNKENASKGMLRWQNLK